MRRLVTTCTALALLAGAATATAQTATPSAPSKEPDIRLMQTTSSGDTGLWFLPTADVLAHKTWAVSFYRTNMDDGQGFSDISTFPATFAIGVRDHVEIFGAWSLITRIDRDTRPLFFASGDSEASTGTGGGILVNYPFVRGAWTGSQLGDAWGGAKVNLLGGLDRRFSAAVRAQIKLPDFGRDDGESTNTTNFILDGVVSGKAQMVDVTALVGFLKRGTPDGYALSNSFRWGFGAGMLAGRRSNLTVTAELLGETYFDHELTAPAGEFGTDGSAVPIITHAVSPVLLSLGLTWQSPKGVFVGGAASWNLSMNGREDADPACVNGTACTPDQPNTPKDNMGLQFRIGFHPGARKAVAGLFPSMPPAPVQPDVRTTPAPAGPTPAPAGPAAAAANRPPTLRVTCTPCTIPTGQTATVTAFADDPDGDPLTYRWTAASGNLAAPTARESAWTAPMQPGPVRFTVTVTDARGASVVGDVTITVTSAAAASRTYSFEDVHFDFDRYTLRTDALAILADAVTAMQANPALRLTIEGHTCNIGTAEYNLALGEHRASVVRDYLVAHGVAADRLRTVSFGEESPKYDNGREETRRLNRRAALVVRLE